MIGIRKCPFCGHNGRLEVEAGGDRDEIQTIYARVTCKYCGATTKSYAESAKEASEAITKALDAWNIRWTERE